MSFSNKALSNREKRHIARWAGKKTHGQIAEELGKQYPDDNGGTRTRQVVTLYCRTLNEEYDSVEVKLNKRIKEKLSDMGFDPTDVMFILEEALAHSIDMIQHNGKPRRRQRRDE